MSISQYLLSAGQRNFPKEKEMNQSPQNLSKAPEQSFCFD